MHKIMKQTLILQKNNLKFHRSLRKDTLFGKKICKGCLCIGNTGVEHYHLTPAAGNSIEKMAKPGNTKGEVSLYY